MTGVQTCALPISFAWCPAVTFAYRDDVPAPPPELAALRVSIDAIDREILRLLAERARLVLRVGEVKRGLALPIYDPDRERQIVDALGALAEAPPDAGTVRRVFERIIDESRTLEQRHAARK